MVLAANVLLVVETTMLETPAVPSERMRNSSAPSPAIVMLLPYVLVADVPTRPGPVIVTVIDSGVGSEADV